MKELNDLIKNFDFRDLSYENLNLFNKHGNIPIILSKVPTNFSIFRCRKCINVGDVFHFEKDISYRTDLKNIKTFGRANLPHESIFYGSINSEAIDKPYFTSIIETSQLCRDKKNGIEFFTIGIWTTNKEIEVASVIPDTNINKNTKDNYITIEKQKQFMIQNSFNDEQFMFYDLIGKEFVKQIDNKKHHEYALSANFTSYIFSSLAEIQGLIFPSVQTEYKGYNIALKPNVVDAYLRLEYVVFGAFYRFEKVATFFPFYFAELKNGVPFKWEKYEEPVYYDNKRIIEFLNKNGVTDEMIIEILINQIKYLKNE